MPESHQKTKEKEGFSIPAQLKLLRGYAETKQFIVVQEFVDVEEPQEKRRLLNFLLSNCTWSGGELKATFRQPFDMIAVSNVAYEKQKGRWRPIQRLFCELAPRAGLEPATHRLQVP